MFQEQHIHSFHGLRWIQQIGLLAMYGSSQLSWQSTAALTQRSWVRIPLKSGIFFGLICNCLNCNNHCDDHISIEICISVVHIISVHTMTYDTEVSLGWSCFLTNVWNACFSLYIDKISVRDVFSESPLNTNTRIIWTIWLVPFVSVLTGFHCMSISGSTDILFSNTSFTLKVTW